MKRLVGLYTTGDSIASVTVGKTIDNSGFNKRPILGPISKVEKCARQDDDVFAVVFVRLGCCVALGGLARKRAGNNNGVMCAGGGVLWKQSSKRAGLWPCG